jgi:dihydroorotase
VSREIDATGLVLLPGVIDPQVHVWEPGLEHSEDLITASRACAKGGVTSFLEMPNTVPLTITQAALDDKLDRAAQKSIVNQGFLIGATSANLPHMLTASPACGIKIFMVQPMAICSLMAILSMRRARFDRQLKVKL